MINSQAKKRSNGQTTRDPGIEQVCEKNQECCQTAHNTFRFLIHNELSLGESDFVTHGETKMAAVAMINVSGRRNSWFIELA